MELEGRMGRSRKESHSMGVVTSPPLCVPARKRAMLANNVLAVLGGALMGLANAAASYEILILGRFLIGAYSGTLRCYGSTLCLCSP